MKKLWQVVVCFCLAALLSLMIVAQGQKKSDKVNLVIETEQGNIEVEIYLAKAPVTATSFLKYVDGGFYEGGVFHRTVKLSPDNQPNNNVKIEVIQGGINPERKDKGFAAIRLERTNQTGLKHVSGAISMARTGPDTATSDFFICLGDQPELDYGGKRNPDGQGFAAFGKVTKGMEVVKRIQQSPAEAQRLTPPIKILRIRRK